MGDRDKGFERVLITAVVVACSLLGDSFLYVALPLEYGALGLSLFSVGVLLSTNRFIRFFSNTWASVIYRRYKIRLPFTLAIFLGAMVTLGYSVVSGFFPFLILRALWGIAWSFLRLAGYLSVSTISNGLKGSTMGLYQSISSIGSLSGALLGGYLLDVLGFHQAALLLSLGSMIGIPIALFLKEGQHTTPTLEKPSFSFNVKFILGDLKLLGIGLVTLVNSSIIVGILVSSFSLYLQEFVGANYVNILGISVGVATLSGFLLTTRLLSRLALGPIFGFASDRFGHRRVLVLSILGGMSGMFLLGLSNSILLIIAALLLAFASSAGMGVVLGSEASHIASNSTELREYALSSYTNWIDIGSALGPFIAYLIRLGIPFKTMYLGSSFIFLLILIVYSFMSQNERSS